jgi:phosphinothricin acetyltransferase
MTLREGTATDAPAIAAIYNESIREADSTMDQTPVNPEEVKAKMRGFRHNELIVVLEDDGDVLGWGIIKRYSEREGYRFACETSVYLRRSHTGRGLGHILQNELLDRCNALGYHHVVAKIWAQNQPSISMHRKCGFEMVGVQKEIGSSDGRWIDVAILQCILDQDTPGHDHA